MPPAAPSTRRVRWWCAGLAVATLLVGLVLQLVPRNIVIDLAGGILYTLLLALLITFLAPRWPSWRPAVLAFGLSALIELSQLTGIPALLVQAFTPLRLVFGSSFDPLDFVAYAIGGLLAWLVRRAIR